MSKPDGGPAFARTKNITGSVWDDGAEGMSLRDYFAAAALQGLLAQEANPRALGYPPAGIEKDAASKLLATSAYDIADAMIAERST